MENNILSSLTQDEKRLLTISNYRKGNVLYYEGEMCDVVSIVVSGEIKISSTSFEGNELVYNIVEKGEIFGNNLILSDEPRYKGNVVATKDTTVVSISKINLLSILQSNREFLTHYLNIQSNFGKKLNSTIKMLSINSAEERFKFYLFQQKGVIKYHSVSDLADILHLKRETLSRLLTKLEKENAISRSPHQIELID